MEYKNSKGLFQESEKIKVAGPFWVWWRKEMVVQRCVKVEESLFGWIACSFSLLTEDLNMLINLKNPEEKGDSNNWEKKI